MSSIPALESAPTKQTRLPKPQNNELISSQDIHEVIKTTQAISVELTEESPEKIEIRNFLQSRIIGQQQPCEKVADAIDIAINSPLPSSGVLSAMFLGGPTGVGKTLTAQSLAKMLLGDENAFIKIECEHLTESYSLSKMIGASDGYVGYGTEKELHSVGKHFRDAKKAGKLHTMIKDRPGFSIVLFDEIEKAHSVITQALLGVLDTGILKIPAKKDKNSYKNTTIDLGNTIIIMTSNIGQNEIRSSFQGFAGNTSEVDMNKENSVIQTAVKKHFSPEFIGRINDFINYERLSQKDGSEIIQRHVTSQNKKLLNYFIEYDIQISLSDSAIAQILEEGFDIEKGARPLVRTVNDKIFRPLGRMINDDSVKQLLGSGNTNVVHFDTQPNTHKFSYSIYNAPSLQAPFIGDVIGGSDILTGPDEILQVCEDINENHDVEDKLEALFDQQEDFVSKYSELGFSNDDINILKDLDQGDLLKNIENGYLAMPGWDHEHIGVNIYADADIFEGLQPRWINRMIQERAKIQLSDANNSPEIEILLLVVRSIQIITNMMQKNTGGNNDEQEGDFELTQAQKNIIIHYSVLAVYSIYG